MAKDLCELVEDQEGRGRGLRAVSAIKRGTNVAPYLGTVYKTGRELYKAIASGHKVNWRYFLELPDHASLEGNPDAKICTMDAAFINDACDAKLLSRLFECTSVQDINTWVGDYMTSHLQANKLGKINVDYAEQTKDGRVWMCAVRDISPGQHVLSMYGAEYWVSALSLADVKWQSKAAAFAWLMIHHFPQLPSVGLDAGQFVCCIPSSSDVSKQNMVVAEFFQEDEAVAKQLFHTPYPTIAKAWLKLLKCPYEGLSGWFRLLMEVGYFSDREDVLYKLNLVNEKFSAVKSARQTKKQQRKTAKKKAKKPQNTPVAEI